MNSADGHGEEAKDMPPRHICTASLQDMTRAEEPRAKGLTDALDKVYAEEPSELDAVVAQMQWLSLPKEDW